MYAVSLGVVLWILYALDVSPVAQWPWWWLLIPFGVAIVWWEWSDASGRTRRVQEDRMAERVRVRRAKAFEALWGRHGRSKRGQ